MKAYQYILIAALSLLTVIFGAIAIFTSGSNTSKETRLDVLPAAVDNVDNVLKSGNNTQSEQTEERKVTPSNPNQLEVSPENKPLAVNADEDKQVGQESTASSSAATPPQTPTYNNAAQPRMYPPSSSPEHVAAAVNGITPKYC